MNQSTFDSQVTIGADPELFLMDYNGEYISSIGKFGGTKRNPKSIGKGCFVQEDNVALEFNIPACSSKDEFLENINYSLSELKERAKKIDLHIVFDATAVFPPEELKHPRAKVFGCDPDLNAWTLATNPSPQCGEKTLRSAGGHVHVGTKKHSAFDIARAMDLFLGVPSVSLDGDHKRRLLYGKAGAYRDKPYGCEYRTLSNFWLRSDKLKSWVYDQTQKALEFLDLGNYLAPDTDGVDIQKCINESDLPLMDLILRRYGLESTFVGL